MSLLTSLIKKPIGCFFTILAGLFLLLLVIGVVGVIVVDHFAINIAAHELKQRSGFTMTTGQQDISALSGAVDLKDIEITNPDRFAAKDFLKFNEIKVKAEPTSVLGKRIIVDEIKVDVDSFTVVRNQDGSYNLVALADGLMPATAAGTPAPKSAATGGSKTAGSSIPPFTVKSLTISIKTIAYIDFKSNGGKPQVTQVNYTKTFTNVDETNYNNVVVQISEDMSLAGASFLKDVVMNQILDPGTYLDMAKGLGGAVLNGASNLLNGAGNLLKKL